MYWEKVKYSYFNFQRWYERIYNSLNDGDIFVEIGTWTGASSLFFAELIKKGSKKINFYTIDTFKGYAVLQHIDLVINKKVYEYFMSVREPLKDYIKVIKGNSQTEETSVLFKDESIAAIFFDGDHLHDGIRRDLENWYPKIKNGGIISGHDYIWGEQGVKPVVDVFSEFKATQFLQGSVWYYTK